jgi:imidazole glycerol-phosphate synthase
MIGIIDYGSGNIKSLTNALDRLKTKYLISNNPTELGRMDKLIFPGLGRAGSAMENIRNSGIDRLIKKWKKPFLGICIGMQILFEYSEEDSTDCLGIIKGKVKKYKNINTPQIGWNKVNITQKDSIFDNLSDSNYFYFVNSYYVEADLKIVLGATSYGISFPSVVRYENFVGVQFHPEKSSDAGLQILKNFVEGDNSYKVKDNSTKRVIACMDVLNGSVVKGVGYKNLAIVGDPVKLAKKYSDDGVDELVFLDIGATINSQRTLLGIIEQVSKELNIPLSVGGGIRSIDDISNVLNAGADKVSIGSAAIENTSFIKEAVNKFGSQCIVVSIDPKKIDGEWYQFSQGGKVNSGIKALDFVKSVIEKGAGEILLNSLDRDGSGLGYDLDLIKAVRNISRVPIIASSGVGKLEHFLEGIQSGADAVLGAGVFHSNKFSIQEVKEFLSNNNILVRKNEK